MSDLLNQFKQLPSIEKHKSPDEIAKDESYSKNTGKGYKKAQKDKLGFYGDFDKSEKVTDKSNTGKEVIHEKENEIKILDKIIKLPEFPIIENLYKNNEIAKEDYLELIEQLENSDKTQSKELIISFLNENTQNSENLSKVKDYFNKTKNIDENNFEKSDFFNKSKELDIKLDYGVGGLEIMLANNYIDISGENKDKNDNIRTTIDITLNKLIDNKSNDFISNNSELIDNIKTEININTKYNLLKELYKEYLIDDAKFGGKKSIEAKRKANNEKVDIEKKIKILKEIAENNNNKYEIESIKKVEEKLQNELFNSKDTLEKIEKEIQKIEGQIQGGENDVISSNIEQISSK